MNHLRFHTKKTQIRYYHNSTLKEEILEIPESEIDFYLQKQWEDKNYIIEFGERDCLGSDNPIEKFLYSSSIFEDVNGDGDVDDNEREHPLQTEQLTEIDDENPSQEETDETPDSQPENQDNENQDNQNNSNSNASEQGDNA